MDSPKDSEATDEQVKPSVSRFGWYWLGGIFVLFILAKILENFDHSTTLVPDHANAIGMAIVLSFLTACLSIIVGLTETKGSTWTKFSCGVLAFGGLGFLAPFLLLGTISSLFFARVDFPPDKVRTFEALLPIGRTWHSTPRRSPESFIIQPTPLWSNIDIAREDWNFMLAELKLGDEPDRDDIPSNGRFCARVQMQQAGAALRVMNAGSHALPKGSIVLCPPEAAGLPFLEVK
jgi:hypothetical protein